MLNFNDTVKTVSGSMVVAACLVGCGGGSGDTSSPNAPKNMLTSTGTTTTTGGTGSGGTGDGPAVGGVLPTGQCLRRFRDESKL